MWMGILIDEGDVVCVIDCGIGLPITSIEGPVGAPGSESEPAWSAIVRNFSTKLSLWCGPIVDIMTPGLIYSKFPRK